MTDFTLATPDLAATVTTGSGALWRLAARLAGREVPLLREPPAGDAREPLSAACFPLVPFGNRLRGNRFRFGLETFDLVPNVEGEALYLHGDGWLADWSPVHAAPQEITLAYEHAADGTPYAYRAEQSLRAAGRALELRLSVRNRGDTALPFGLGWHPYLPLTPQTTLEAPAGSYWTEGPGHLPVEECALPEELDFAAPRRLPGRWINNGFEGWNGRARVVWPEHGLALDVEAGPAISRYVLFLPGPQSDSFCLEPMTHAVDAHSRADGGLVALEPGEALEARLTLAWSRI